MKLHCHRPTLTTAFQIVSGVVPTRTPKDILRYVKLEVRAGKAVLIGTDQEVGIRYEIEGVESDSEGATLLPTNRVLSILRELQSDSLDFEVTPEAVFVRAAQSEFRLSAADPTEFPVVREPDVRCGYAVASKSLREMIRRTVFATDIESTRYALGGIQMELDDGTMTLVATDSRRLAVVSADCRRVGEGGESGSRPVIPSKAMTLFERTTGDDDEEALIVVDSNEVQICSGAATISSRLVEGRFPQYREVIPAQSSVEVELVAGPFHSVVRQSQIITSEESRGVEFCFAPGTLTLQSQAADVGESRIELPISYDGDDVRITFDPRYVAEFLRVLDAETQVRLRMTDGESAAVFETGDNYTYVVMPLSKDR